MKMRPLTRAAISLACVVSGLFLAASATPVTADGPGTTTRVSVASDGTQGNGPSSWTSISAAGRYVAFESDASNLVPGDANGTKDVFVHDRQTGETALVSVASDGAQGNASSYAPSISADGRYVAFQSDASNLVPGDTNARMDVFVRDMQVGQTTRVSVASDGSQGNRGSSWPSISTDGGYVAFFSGANNLVAGYANVYGSVFVRDLRTGQTTLVSVAADGTEGNGWSGFPSISADGRYLAFRSGASNLVPGDTNGPIGTDIFVRDLLTDQTKRVSVASDGTQGNSGSDGPSISADGGYVAFESRASNLVPGDANGTIDVFVRDLQAGQTTLVSVASDGTQGNEASAWSFISADGRHVGFVSSASNLVRGYSPRGPDVFIHDVQTGQTTLGSVASDGTQSDGNSGVASISADGRYVAFRSDATNLVPGDTNGQADVFVHDRGAAAAPLVPSAYLPSLAKAYGGAW